MSKQPLVPCKLCGAVATFLCDTPNEHSGTPILHHYRCTGCGLVFIGNRIDSAELAIAYGTIDQNAYYADIQVATRRKFERSMRDLSALVSSGSRLIDVGTGNGMFLGMLVQSGFTEVSGHEIPGEDLSTLEAAGCRMYRDFDYGSIPSDHFDVVTLLDVAEHVIDPLHLFRACSRILRPGGLIYFHTPVVTRTDRLMHALQRLPVLGQVGRFWQRGRTSIFHQQNYTVASLEMLLHDAGFASVSLTVENELSWPVRSYVRTYLCRKYGLPDLLAPLLSPFVYPFLATNLFNANKAIGWARKGR